MAINTQDRPSALFNFLFVKPVPVIIWVLLLVIVGLIAYSSMVKESLPDIEIPQAYIVTTWEGASPEMIEKEITQKLEQSIKGMKGLKKYYSASQHQISIVAVHFHANMSATEALELLQRKVSEAEAEFPKGAQKPRIEESSVRDFPIATFNLSGDVSKFELEKQARRLKENLEMIQGIKNVKLVGESKQIVQILLHPERIKALGISPSVIRQSIMAHNHDAPWGRFENSMMGFDMRMAGTYNDLESLKNLAITHLPDGHTIRLKDIALVRLGYMREKSRASLSWKGSSFIPVIAMNLFKSPGHDTVKLVDKAKQILSKARNSESWHPKIGCQVTDDESKVIHEELSRGFSNGWQAMLAVFIVLMIMLTWREALVAAFSIPLTFLGSISVLWFLGYSFNLLVIVGIIFALGLLIDDFILIMEGMHEAIFLEKLDYVSAVQKTVKTYAIPSLSGTLTTICVLIPLAFLGGIDGKFIRVIPVTAVVCLSLSYVISVVLGPPLSRPVLKHNRHSHKTGRIDHLAATAGKQLAQWLNDTVIKTRSRAVLWVFIGCVLFFLSLIAADHMRNTLYPKEDGRGLGITIELAPASDLNHAEHVSQKIGVILQNKPYLQYVLKVVGEKDAYAMGSFHDMLSPTHATNYIGFSCFLVPRNQRKFLAHKYVEPLREEIQKALKEEPGTKIIMSPQIGGPSSEDPLQIDIQGDDCHVLKDISIEVQKILNQIPGIVDIRDNMGPPRNELIFEPLPEALNFYHVSQYELGQQMITYMENEKIGKFHRTGTQDDLDIRLGTWWSSQSEKMGGPKDWEELERIKIINDNNKPVSLWRLVTPKMDSSQHVIKHKNGQRSVTVMSKLHGIYVSEIIERMRPIMNNIQKSWPSGYSYVFAGEDETDETYKKMGKMFCLAMLLVYIILALLFDSLIQPVIILFTVLFALIGVFTGFFWADIPFSFSATIGVVALVGIVVNDSIIIVDTMNGHRKAGLNICQAAQYGASDRLRPIVSTTLTNLAGLLPLAFSDPGWSPLCMAIIFGEITATFGAVIFIPALYVALGVDK